MRQAATAGLLLLICVGVCLPCGAQEPDPTFKVNVKLVNVFVTVTDEHGAPIANLKKDNFELREDGKEQKISVFDKESALPLSIVLAVDTSLSTRKDLPLESASARRFAHAILPPIDALFLGAQAFEPRQGRKVMVIITDGGDTMSKVDYKEAVRAAEEAEAILYSIIVVPIEASAGRDTGGEHALIQLSDDTGGKYFYAKSLTQLDDAFRQISDELRTQYLLAYYPSQRLSDSEFRRIQVAVNGLPASSNFKVRHRIGYFSTKSR